MMFIMANNDWLTEVSGLYSSNSTYELEFDVTLQIIWKQIDLIWRPNAMNKTSIIVCQSVIRFSRRCTTVAVAPHSKTVLSTLLLSMSLTELEQEPDGSGCGSNGSDITNNKISSSLEKMKFYRILTFCCGVEWCVFCPHCFRHEFTLMHTIEIILASPDLLSSTDVLL